MTHAAHILPIERRHDRAMARVIRDVMSEFEAEGPGFSRDDPEVDHLTDAYAAEGAGFWVVELDGEVVGGGGFGPLTGGDAFTCELRKMYLLPCTRGRGLGARLLDHILKSARSAGYRRCYLESTESMTAAARLYESRGFRRLDQPLGTTGHQACNVWMLLDWSL
jgi:putative acetyltransferase